MDHNLSRCSGPKDCANEILEMRDIQRIERELRYPDPWNTLRLAILARELGVVPRNYTLVQAKRGGAYRLYDRIIDHIAQEYRRTDFAYRRQREREQMEQELRQEREQRRLDARRWKFTTSCIEPTNNEKFTCLLCLDEKENVEKVKICNCQGFQCYTCFDDFYRRNKAAAPSCPMCRSQIGRQSTVIIENPEILPILQGLVQ
jgi:hypothetical protein